MPISADIRAEILEPLARTLTEIKQDQERAADSRSWDMALTYVQTYAAVEDLHQQMGLKITTHKINKSIRQFEWYQGPGSSWLSNAYKTAEVFPEFFIAGDKKRNNVAYWAVKDIANCSLSSEDAKRELLEWYVNTRPTRAELRAEIRARVDAQKGVSKPDFDLKVSNTWKFNEKTTDNGFDGGIAPDLVANLLYYFTEPGDVVIDPMAGGDTTYQVVRRYAFFSDPNCTAEFSGPRTVYRSDIEPRHPGIEQADVTVSLPWPDAFADFCLLDPPYYGIAEGKYAGFGRTIDEWVNNLACAVANIKRVLKPGGVIAVIVDDYLRSKEFQPLGFLVFDVLRQAGLVPEGTIYNPYPNFVTTMGPAQMWRAKQARMQVSEMKIVNVFTKP